MSNKNSTLFQRLGQVVSPEGIKVQKQQSQRYNIGDNELLKTNSKQEYDTAKLQAQQKKYLGQTWKKVESGLFQQSINYETTRIGSYVDFEAMEFYPIIAAALDVMMEESTTVNDSGRMINIYSDSKRVKTILEDLFFNRLDLHTSLPMWTRNTCKYGDNFLYLNIDESQGVLGGKQMPNYEMERREFGLFDMISGRETTIDEGSDSGKVKFFWRGRDVEFNSWQIAHFRLLGDDRRLPYGTCLKYNSRVETSEGYKEIKDIVIGDMVYSFDEINQVKVLSKVLDTINSGNKKTYKLSTKHNFIDASKEHKIMYYNTELNKFDYKNTLDFKVGDLLVVDKINLNNVNVPIIRQKNKYDLIGNRLTNDFILEPIKSIEESGEHETYDIYVENDNHNFYANGIVVHNSVLEKARRIWKQLILSEDSMLVYRVTRAPERRVYKIYVGNIDDADVEQYVNTIADRFKRMPITDPQTGQIDLRYNQLSNDQDFFIPVRTEDAPNPIDTLPGACIALDTRIPLLDGRTLELNEIITEWNNGNRNLWVYSCDPISGALAPGVITWAGETRKNTEVMKITLDNGESITTTPDHKWVHRTKGFVEAQDLVIGDSLMPFYRDEEYILKKKYSKKYERVWDSLKQEWVFTHRMVNSFMKDKNKENYFTFEGDYYKTKMKTIHHVDNDRFNNVPKNLTLMNSRDHYQYHRHELWSTPDKAKENIRKITKGINKFISNQTEDEKSIRGEQSKLNSINSRIKSNETFNNNLNKYGIIKLRGEAISKAKSTDEFKESFSKIAKENWESDEYRRKVFSKKQTITFSDKLYNMFFEMFKLCGKADLTLVELNSNEDFMTEFTDSNKDIRSSLTNLNEFTRNHLDKMIKERGFKNYRDWCKVTAEELGYKNVIAWRYYIEKSNKSVEEANYNHKIVNIEWLKVKEDTGTITVDGDELYHNYHTFATEAGNYLKNSNLDQIADIEYLRSNLFTALRVPKPFLGFDETSGDGKNLAIQDVRFSRTINRIQQSMLQELNKIAIIHLYILGFEDDLDNFTLTLNNPSTQAEMLKIENLQLKVSLLKDATSDIGTGFSTMSWTRAHREILGWSDDEIKQDLLEQRMEKAAAAELANTANVIKHTGMFDTVDRIYGDYQAALEGGAGGEAGGVEAGGGGETGGGGLGGGFGGGFGGGGTGGEDLDFGDAEDGGADEVADEGADEGADGGLGGEAGGTGAESGGEDLDFGSTLSENIKRIDKQLTERKNNLTAKLNKRTKKYESKFIDILIEAVKPSNKDKGEKTKVYDKNIKINNDIDNMIDDIDKMLE